MQIKDDVPVPALQGYSGYSLQEVGSTPVITHARGQPAFLHSLLLGNRGISVDKGSTGIMLGTAGNPGRR